MWRERRRPDSRESRKGESRESSPLFSSSWKKEEGSSRLTASHQSLSYLHKSKCHKGRKIIPPPFFPPPSFLSFSSRLRSHEKSPLAPFSLPPIGGQGEGEGGDFHRVTLQNTVPLPKAIFDPPIPEEENFPGIPPQQQSF